MPAVTYLSKGFTVAKIKGVLRILANSLSPGNDVDNMLEDIIYMSILDVYELLQEAGLNDYVTKATVAQGSNVIDVTAKNFDKIVKLVDGTNGLCVEVGLRDLENVPNIPQYNNSICWAQYGEYLQLKKGSGVTDYGTLYLYYKKVPTRWAIDTDTLDIRDMYMLLVVDKAKMMLYELLSKQAPKALSESIQTRTNNIRQGNLQEKEISKKK